MQKIKNEKERYATLVANCAVAFDSTQNPEMIVSWVEPDQINISRGDISMTLYINKRSYAVNGIEKQLDIPPWLPG